MTQSDAKLATTVTMFPIVALLVWWLLDRDAPYIRSNGVIVTADPLLACGVDDPNYVPGKIVAGSCVSVVWETKPLKNCKPAGPFNVTRSITDSQGQHPLSSIRSIYSVDKNIDTPIVRSFTLPVKSPVGPAIYESSACFVCNPLQEMFPSYLKICVDKPNVPYEVEMSSDGVRGPAGPVGPTGPQGNQGEQGVPGPKGE